MRFWAARELMVLAVVATVLASAGCSGSGGRSPTEVAEAARPATVQLYGMQGKFESGATGVVYDAKRGLVLTNAHVVAGLTALRARGVDQTEVPAHVVGASPCDDVAVVQLERVPKGTKAVTFGDSDKVKRAEEVSAVGYPESYVDVGGSAGLAWKQLKGPARFNSGTVSLANMAVEPSTWLPRYPSVIQHSATVNYGDSGGPLLNDRGQLIGINTVDNEYAQPGRVRGQFFAIAINRIKPLLADLEAGRGRGDSGWGLVPFATVPVGWVFDVTGYAPAAQGYVADKTLSAKGADGVFVFGVRPGSAAAAAGIEGGDLLTSLNGTTATTVAEACTVLGAVPAGGSVVAEGVHLARAGARGEQLDAPFTTTLNLR